MATQYIIALAGLKDIEPADAPIPREELRIVSWSLSNEGKQVTKELNRVIDQFCDYTKEHPTIYISIEVESDDYGEVFLLCFQGGKVGKGKINISKSYSLPIDSDFVFPKESLDSEITKRKYRSKQLA